MKELWIIMISIIVFDLLLFGGLGLFIWKSDKIYLKDEGRWIPGFNLPRLYAEQGDIVDHDGFKRHIGLSFMKFGFLFTLAMVIFIYVIEEQLFSEMVSVSLFMLLTFGVILYLVYSMFTQSEKFIQRVTSKRIRYDIYVYRMLIWITLFNTVPYFFGTVNLMYIVLGSILITFIVVVYYIYRIYQLLKENKKDFL